MKTANIAKILMDHRTKSMSSFIQTGALRNQLGTEGYAEALQRRWIVADEDLSGMVRVTNDMTKVAQIREAAQFAEEGEPAPVQESQLSRLSAQHAGRRRVHEAVPPEQKKAMLQQAIPKMRQQFDHDIAERGMSPEQADQEWQRILAGITEYWMTDPEVDQEIEMELSSPGSVLRGGQQGGQPDQAGAGAMPPPEPEIGGPHQDIGPEYESLLVKGAIREMFGTGQPMAGSSPTYKSPSPVTDKAKEEESFDSLLDAYNKETDPSLKDALRKKMGDRANRTP